MTINPIQEKQTEKCKLARQKCLEIWEKEIQSLKEHK